MLDSIFDEHGNLLPQVKAERQSVRLKMQALSGFDVLSMVPVDVLARIKETDAHPFFQAYSFCHEGTSNPTILGDTAKPITWMRRAVQSIKNAITKGVKFFLGHNEDNSTTGRQALGEVVASQEMEIDGALHHVAVGYFPNRDAVKDFDICSQEADWDLVETPLGWLADKIDKLTGIALSSSKVDKPAFSGARRLGIVQAFDTPAEPVKQKEKIMATELMACSFAELAAELTRRNVFPSQVFTLDQIRADGKIAPSLEKAEKHDALVKELADEKAAHKATADKLKVTETEAQTAKRGSELITAKTRLEKLAKDANATEKQLPFVLNRFTKNADKLSDLTDDGLKKFLDEQVAIYNDAQGIDAKTETSSAATGASGNENPKDMTKAANNPLISENLEI